MSLGSRLLFVLSTLALVIGSLTAGAHAARVVPSELAFDARPAYAGSDTTLRLTLSVEGGEPIGDAEVTLERRTASGWAPIGTVTTDADGHASRQLRLERTTAENLVRATYAGDPDHAPVTDRTRLELRRRGSTVVVRGPGQVEDGQAVPVRVRWTTRSGTPVEGVVKLFRSLGSGPWRKVRLLHTGADGRAQVSTKPRQDSRWRARAVRQAWVEGDESPVHRVANIPPGVPVKLPRAAPRPRRSLPDQPHAVGAGANVRITAIPDRVWGQMTGVSWHRGCPVGRAGLRLVRVNYWDYRGYPRRGELVASASAAHPMGAALTEMFRRSLPIRAMYRVDRFGWGARSRGADDYASMAAGNTSAFNCRDVTGRPGVRSPHSYGRALDLNTWENPYRSARGTVPDTWWQGHSHPRVAWRSRSHPVVRLMARHGLRWTYGLGDTQHFDYVGSSARAMVAPRPCDRYCD
jgi:5-hydroxyisourate hydrolase-like protein (transthyretin family)